MATRSTESASSNQAKLNPELWLRTLDEIKGTDLSLVGGKAFRLAQLKQYNLKVPPGLVLTAYFFEAQLQHTQLTPLWAGSPDIAVTTKALNWLADALKTKPLAKKLSGAFNKQLDALFDKEIDSFAVRSSAIDEDQYAHTFAGVHLTELGVPRNLLPIAITRCWASALAKPALEYRQAHGLPIQSIRMAVLIQPMLNPKSSGVGFTINPLTNARDELVIEATWGLGETLVSGTVQPYFYRLANQPPDYPLIEQQAGNVSTLSTNDGEQVQTGPLSATELTELAIQLEQIQALMGEAQDVEWAKQDDGFSILQTRPVLLTASETLILDVEWTRGSHPEFLPELPSPLFGSLLEQTQNRAITFFREIGLTVDDLGPYVKLILGRPYLNMSFLKRVIAQVGIAPGKLLYTIGHSEPGGIGGTLSIDWEIAWKVRGTYWHILKRVLVASRSLKKYQALADEAVTILNDANMDASPTILLGQLRQHDKIYGELFNTNLRLATAISAITAIASSLIVPFTQTPAIIISTLALKGVKTVERELNQALLKLGHLARKDARTQTYLCNAPDDFQDYNENRAISPEFRRSFDELLAKYGDRAIYEADMGWPRYRDDLAPLLRIIRQYAQNIPQNRGRNLRAHPAEQVNASWQNLIHPAKGFNRLIPWQRWLAAPLIRILRRLLSMREELHTARARAMTACRYWDLALGKKWVDEEGWLAQPEDIFWLTMDEIERTLIIGDNIGITLSSTIKARKETYQTYAETAMPFSLQESEIASIQFGMSFSLEPSSDVMVGLPISPGQARGTVLILNSPEEFEISTHDIILVIPSTDPAWLPLLHLATGLIVEMGGLLSHGSVIAREYGLPAVANIPGATQRFQNGDSVLVDGSTGVIQLLESAPSSPPS